MSEVSVAFATGLLAGAPVQAIARTLAEMRGVYRDEPARRAMDPARVVYRVQSYLPVAEGTEGGLFWGSTFLEPGKVGDEYFMTKGHFHARRDRAEYYVTVAGAGALILMNGARRTWMQTMSPGSVHYVPPHTAHRVANTGDTVLSFLACWPSDAGHDYETIAKQGFSARLRAVGGVPALIPEP